jgi:hypothetical protein
MNPKSDAVELGTFLVDTKHSGWVGIDDLAWPLE